MTSQEVFIEEDIHNIIGAWTTENGKHVSLLITPKSQECPAQVELTRKDLLHLLKITLAAISGTFAVLIMIFKADCFNGKI